METMIIRMTWQRVIAFDYDDSVALVQLGLRTFESRLLQQLESDI